MAATATSTAPTEAEIRAVFDPWRFDDAWSEHSGRIDLLYDTDDMRPSHLERLDHLLSEALDPIRDAAVRDLNDAIAAAVLRFAAEHPDAPRAAGPAFATFPSGTAADDAIARELADWPDARVAWVDDGHGGGWWTVAVDTADGQRLYLRPDGSVR